MPNRSNHSGVSINAPTKFIYQESFESAVAKNVIVVVLALVISYINGTLVHTYRQHQIFYTNPRYILFIHLVLNDTLQLLTFTALFVMAYTSREILCWLCMILLSVVVLTTHATPLTLAVMATECYVAVCFPLRHAQLWTVLRTYVLIGGIWVLCGFIILPDVFILVANKPPAYFSSRVFCDLEWVFGLPVLVLKRDVQYIIYLSGVWFILIFTYCHIFFAARAAKSTEAKSRKARNTILLHGFQLFLCTLSYVDHLVLRILKIWFLRYIVHIVFVVLVLVMILPRLISSVAYGLRDKAFRQHLKKYFLLTIVIQVRKRRTHCEEVSQRRRLCNLFN